MKGFDKASMVRRNKLINNLPRYDLGTTPINRGYQSASNSIPSPFVSLAGQNLSLMVSGLKLANTAQIVNSGAQLATLAVGIADVAKLLSTGAIKSGTAAMLSAASTIPSAMQLYGAMNTKGSFDGLGGNDLDMLASKNTEYRNGVAYENIGNVDSNNIMKAARAREFGENMNLTTSAIGTGAGVGATIGSFFPGAGNLIGAGIGALVGGLGSLLGWNNDEVKEQRRRLQNWRIASNAANTQNEAVASSTGLRNEFYATHADRGLSPAFVGGGETKVATNGKGKVTNYTHFLETGATPRHADNILTQMKDTDGVLGNTVDPFTGRLVSDESRDVIYDPTLTKNQKNDLLTQFLWNQDVALNGQNTNMKIGRFDQGKPMGILSMIPGIMEWATGLKQENYYKTQPPAANNPATINNNAAAALAKLDALHYSPYNLYRNLYRLNKQLIYNLNNASISPGMRQALRNQYTSDLAYHLADINSQAQLINNQYTANAAKTALETGEADAQRRMAGQTEYNKGIANAVARQLKGIETGWQTKLKGINTAFGNWLNNYWTDRTIGLYEQAYKTPPVDILAMNEEMSNAFKTPSKEQTIKQLQKPNGILTRDIKSGNGYDDVVNQWEQDYALMSVLPSVPRITGEDIVLREPDMPAGAEKRTIGGLPKLEGNELEPFWSRRPELEYYELPDGTHTYHRPSRMPILYRDYEPNAWDMLQKSGKFKHLNETLFNDLTGIDWSNVPLAILKDLPMYKYRNVTGVDWSNPKLKLKRSNK